MTEHDRTFSEAAAYGSRRWVARELGLSESAFDKKRQSLEAQGFPLRDRVIGLYLKADVAAWISRRRQIADKMKPLEEQKEEPEINDKAL